MNDSFLQKNFADRIGGPLFGKDTVLYKFAKIKAARREALAANPGRELFDFGVGEPDEMAFPGVVDTLCAQARLKENRGYADNGIAEFKTAAASYLQKVFSVKEIDPETEINHSIGSKPALAMLPYAFINPGDICLATVPGYPVTATHAKYCGGSVYELPLMEKNGFFPELEKIPADILNKAKILYINYPNNPTGASATYDFFRKVIDFGIKNKILVIQDAAYAAITWSAKPLSILSLPKAKDTAVEIHSLSKAFNMTGWRLAFVAGNSLAVKAFAAVKDNYDSGQFKAIQHAGIYALSHPEISEKISSKYKRRMDLLVKALAGCGFKTSMPGGSFYLYVKAPAGIKNGRSFASAGDFSEYLIKEKLISTVPWDDAGAYVRFSVTFEVRNKHNIESEEKRIIEETAKRLGSEQFIFNS
ncbi:MAG: aspartate aminotransferase [Spirochaetes bacterium GWF1_41_5]|nr:MAG: aspartate aminotransferase [Spirochaetes bacterium GWF1_41_5]HBE02456.1 aspartate aminotransferase [Spirochaetia bacterium]